MTIIDLGDDPRALFAMYLEDACGRVGLGGHRVAGAMTIVAPATREAGRRMKIDNSKKCEVIYPHGQTFKVLI